MFTRMLPEFHEESQGKRNTFVNSATVFASAKLEQQTSTEVRVQPGRLPRILLVEDEQILRDVLVPILFSAGYDCREAASGQSAIDLLHSGTRVNLILSNMLLPKVDGWTLFLYVKQNYPKVPFVFVTAIDDSGVREAAMREGAADYLLKPFTCEELLTTVRRVLGQRAA